MIKPGKVTCAGLVAILMVLPNSLWWKDGSARDRARTVRIEPPAFARRPALSTPFEKGIGVSE